MADTPIDPVDWLWYGRDPVHGDTIITFGRWAKAPHQRRFKLAEIQPTEHDHPPLSFQKKVLNWLMECFSQEICRDTIERNHRFLEESLELVQSLGCTASEAHQLVDYVFGRPVGEPKQEVGGVMVTLAALCSAADMDMEKCGDVELERCWRNIAKIRAKQAAKPKHSPLPGATLGLRGNRPDMVIIDDPWKPKADKS